MTFDEWWDSLSTREQNSTDRDLTKAAWHVSAMLMQERCAKVCDTVGITLDTREMSRGAFVVSEAIRALGNE